MSENKEMSKLQQKIVAKLNEALDLIKEGDNMSMFVYLVEKRDDCYVNSESLKGVEEDVFYAMVAAAQDEKPSKIKNILSNFFKFEMTKMVKAKMPQTDDKQPDMKVIKSKGDA